MKNDEINVNRLLDILKTTVMIGFAITCVYYYYQAFILEKPYPYNTFLNAPITRFGDFYGVFSEWVTKGFSGVGYGMSYFPGMYLVADFFRLITLDPYEALYIFQFIYISIYMFIIFRYVPFSSISSRLQNLIVFSIFSYPFLFTFSTGNLEAFIFLFLFAYFISLERQKYHLASFLIAIPISMKFIPAIFLYFFISKRLFKYIGLTAIYTLLFCLFPLMIFKGGILDAGFLSYLSNLRESQKMYFDLMILGGAGNHYGHSILNALRLTFVNSFPDMKDVLRPYMFFSLVTFGFIFYRMKKLRLPFWKELLIITCCFNLLPYTSTDYKLLHVISPIIFFFRRTQFTKIDLVFVLLFGLILIPKSWFYLGENPFRSLNSILNPLIMLSFVVICLIPVRGCEKNEVKVSN